MHGVSAIMQDSFFLADDVGVSTVQVDGSSQLFMSFGKDPVCSRIFLHCMKPPNIQITCGTKVYSCDNFSML
jgi:hypothetical protein